MTETRDYSHPDASIRHLYPLAHGNSDLSAAIDIFKQSVPMVVTRLVGLVGFSLGLLVCTGVFAWVLALAAKASDTEWLKWGGLYIGAIIAVGVYPLLRDILFAKPRLAHMLLLTEATIHKDLSGLPVSPTMSSAVIEHYSSSFERAEAIEICAKGILKEFHSKVGRLREVFPNVRSEALLCFLVGRLSYLPDMILSYTVARDDSNDLRAAKDGIVYYVKNSAVLLRSAFGCYLSEAVCSLGVLLIALGPAVFLGFLVPDFMHGWMTFFAVLLTLNVKDAIIHPVFLAFMLQKFHFELKGQRFSEETEAGLIKMSEEFKDLETQAKAA